MRKYILLLITTSAVLLGCSSQTPHDFGGKPEVSIDVSDYYSDSVRVAEFMVNTPKKPKLIPLNYTSKGEDSLNLCYISYVNTNHLVILKLFRESISRLSRTDINKLRPKILSKWLHSTLGCEQDSNYITFQIEKGSVRVSLIKQLVGAFVKEQDVETKINVGTSYESIVPNIGLFGAKQNDIYLVEFMGYDDSQYKSEIIPFSYEVGFIYDSTLL